MKHAMVRLSLLGAGLLLCVGSPASDAYLTTITHLYKPLSNTNVFVTVDGTVPNTPSCHTATSYNFVFNIGTAQADAVFSMLLTAHTAGLTVKVKGTGACDISANYETLQYVILY